MINPRFQPGGDKWYSIREDERRSFYDIAREDGENFINSVKTSVSSWTENEIEMRNKPTVEEFVKEYKEYDHDELYATIAEEMKRIELILSRTSEAV